MKLKDLLSEKRGTILKRWFDKVLETYPAETSGFLKNQKRQFTNPVGYTISQGLEKIFEGLLQDTPLSEISPFLDDIIRIRAVQGLTPSQDLAFMFDLKKMIRDEMKTAKANADDEILELESRIDALALIAFDIYMKCREKIYELKANEVKNMTFRLLQRANLMGEVQGE
ncbi:MAG TPA: hypothetical protein DCP92_03295 [Nitrospiraceae bacterium]|nr:hypothetical protein [Nitrospiraceae bacterium]